MRRNSKQIVIDGRNYKVKICRKVIPGPDACRIIIPTYMPNIIAKEITRVCIQSVKKYTTEPYQIWVIDNNSPNEYSKWLNDIPFINVVFNKTKTNNPFLIKKYRAFRLFNRFKIKDNSYANAVGLEIGIRCIEPSSKYVFVMDSDTLVLKNGWLSYLKSKLSSKVRAIGCWHDNIRVHALQSGGLLMDFTLFKLLGMNFMPNTRQERTTAYPEYDVGDLITIRLKEHNYDIAWCKNTHNNLELIDRIQDETLRKLHSNRCFDDDWNVFYIHMGRGLSKSVGTYNKEGKTYPRDWIDYAKKYVLR